MSDEQIEEFLETRDDDELPGVVWDESGRTVVDRAILIRFIHSQQNP